MDEMKKDKVGKREGQGGKGGEKRGKTVMKINKNYKIKECTWRLR